MALQSSGPISLSQINLELGRSSTSTISLSLAETGTYAMINQASPSRPSGTTPSSLSEWYSYNHSAANAPTSFQHDISADPMRDPIEACSVRTGGVAVFSSEPDISMPGPILFMDPQLTMTFDGAFAWYFVPAYRVSINVDSRGNIIDSFRC